MSARTLQRVTAKILQSGRRSWACLYCTNSTGDQQSGNIKPKKPFEQPKTAGTEGKSAPPPPPPEQKFDNSKYQVEELFQYNTLSFYDLEVALSPSRCPRQSSIKKGS